MRARLRVTALIAAGLIVSGCLATPVTDQARAVSDLWTVFVVAAAFVGALVWGLITFAILRYRGRPSRPGDRTEPPPRSEFRHALPLEIAWTTGPILIVLFLFAMTLLALDRIDAHERGAIDVHVNAFRWQWRFDYPASGVTVTGTRDAPAEMVVPVGEPVHVLLTSEDVIHSFYVPAFLFKRDAIPGHPTEFDFTVDTPGGYGGQCAEFCGVYHDRMLLTVRAVPRAEFDAWLASHAAASGSPGVSGSPGASGSPAATPAGSGTP